MKKIYLLAIAVAGMAFTTNAQIINDDMESYFLGPLEEGHWGTWGGSEAERLIIVNSQAHSGSQSGMIAGGGVQDAILKLDNQSDGEFTLSWYMYVPAGKTGYYNFQEDEDPGDGAWGLNIHFNYQNSGPGTGLVVDDANPGNVVTEFAYPEGTWFQIKYQIDLDADTTVMFVDGNEVYNGPFFTGSNLGGVDFFSIDANTEYYIDDVLFVDGIVGIEDFAADSFSVYPNPVSDFLNIKTKTAVDQVTVYDVLGKMVLTSNPGIISPKIDMSTLTSGAYMVKVTIGNSSKTVKVVK